jgi:hypothetical protein
MMDGLLREVAMAIYISLIKFTDNGIKNICAASVTYHSGKTMGVAVGRD